MKVDEIMTRKVVTVELDEKLEAIREIFAHFGFHHLLVVEKQVLVGVISDRDLLRALSPFLNTISEEKRDREILKKKAHQIMSRKLISIDKDTSIEVAAKKLLENNISCLPVISPKGEVEGIVTWKDIL